MPKIKNKGLLFSLLRFLSGRWIHLVLLVLALAGLGLLLHQLVSRSLFLAEKEVLQDFHPPKPPPDIVNLIGQMKAATPSATGPFRVPILMYHYIEYPRDKNDKIRISLTTTPATLEKQIKTLQGDGYTLLTARDLGDIFDGKMGLPVKPILLTFDDGYQDFYTDAYPVLKKYHAKATAYIVSGFLNGPNYMTTSQVTTIAKDGLVEIGAHTVHHVALRKASSTIVNNEVVQSRDALQNLTGLAIVSFAYPFGSFDQVAINVVQKAGFKTAVSTLPGILQGSQNRYFLFRLRPGARIGTSLLEWLNRKNFTPY